MEKSNNILELKRLSLGYTKDILVDNISVSAKKGKLIALMGLNGTGKTTLFKTILQEIKPISGEIILKNNNIFSSNSTAQEISDLISVVFTERVRIFGFTVFDLIAMGRMPHTNRFGKLKNQDLEIINNYIHLLDLEKIKDVQINNLSDGQFQKVMIAKALSQETPLVLLDEPTAFLDIKNKEMIYNLLKKITQEIGKTVIVSTHNLDFCKDFCDSIWLIQNKKLQELDSKIITKEMFF